jgi:hypothetical protein
MDAFGFVKLVVPREHYNGTVIRRFKGFLD